MRTVAQPIEGTEVRLEPAEEPGITIAGVPAGLDSICKADVRVDLADITQAIPDNRTRSFVVEHVLGPLGLHGVTAARVTGIRETWDFARPEHRFCYSIDGGPEQVLGHPAGLPNPELSAAIAEADIVGEPASTRTTVSERLTYEANGGTIRLAPRPYGAGIAFAATYGDASIEATVDPAGDNDADLVDRVVHSTTPYLSPSPAESVTHAIADLVSDLAVLGGFDDLRVEADLGDAYHALTIGAARKARDEGLVRERQS